MRGPDLDRERSEKMRSLTDFLALYNKGLPRGFPRASRPLLERYKRSFSFQFKADGLWSLDQHRKKLMDWLPTYLKSHEGN